MLSSLPLQIVIFFDTVYAFLWAIAMLVLFAWKGARLPYEGQVRSFLGLEVALVFVLLVIELSRLFMGERGNKLEQATPLLGFVILTLVAALGNFYFLYLQIFVTRADLILNAVSLAFQGLGVLLAIPTLITFRRVPKAVEQ